MMDNLLAHKVASVRQAIRAKSAELLYLPPYSPDLNPIELLLPSSKAQSPVAQGCRTLNHRPLAQSASCSTSSQPPNVATISHTPITSGGKML
jgi:hypothetical protein